MRRSIVVLLVLAVALTLAATPVSADPKVGVSGTWDYELVGIPEVIIDGTTVVIRGQDVGEWHGTFEGFTEEDFVVICYPGVNLYRGEMTFTGSVEDGFGVRHEGTMVLNTRGRQYSDTCDPSPAEWNGRWVISGGTGGLADIDGRGTFYGPSFHLFYDGHIGFS